jgi:hypothetical protein
MIFKNLFTLKKQKLKNIEDIIIFNKNFKIKVKKIILAFYDEKAKEMLVNLSPHIYKGDRCVINNYNIKYSTINTWDNGIFNIKDNSQFINNVGYVTINSVKIDMSYVDNLIDFFINSDDYNNTFFNHDNNVNDNEILALFLAWYDCNKYMYNIQNKYNEKLNIVKKYYN